MLRVALASLATVLLTPCAFADKFYFTSDEETAKEEEDSIPDMIVGVLTAQDEEMYTIRVEGGEIQLAKDLVVKIEADDLTVADIEAVEAAAAPALAQADLERREFLAVERAEAAARREEARAVEAAMIEAEVAAAAEAVYVPGVPPALAEATYFDPVIGIPVSPVGAGMGRDQAMLRDMFYRYQQYRTREMAKQMRQLRRYQ